MKYNVWIFECDDLYKALTDPDIALVYSNGYSERDALDVTRILSQHGVGVCMMPEPEE
jgi:hypothetical protein